MVFRLDDENVGFPDPRNAEPDGLLAVGGSLEPLWLLNAYYMGIFPWFQDGDGLPYWFSPDPRMVLIPRNFHCSKSLRRLIKSGRMEVRVDTCFRRVMEMCASVSRENQKAGSWITSDFIERYCEMHRMGLAHSFETFLDGKLVGGLYGISISDFFCGESMFHIERDASKVAFAKMVEFAKLHRFRFIDTQLYTDHLASLGAKEMPRDVFLDMLAQQDFKMTYRGRWKNNSAVLLLGGNQGNRVGTLMKAVFEIGNRIGSVALSSAIYETEPWGFEAQQSFLNQAIVVDTDLDAYEVLRVSLEIEKELGRQRQDSAQVLVDGERLYSSRPIDIDVIFFNSDVVDSPSLVVPHPRMHLRRFVLQPIAQIIPDFEHPKLHKTMSQLLEECDDNGEVKEYFL